VGRCRRSPRSPKRVPRGAALQVTAAFGLFLLLALAGCNEATPTSGAEEVETPVVEPQPRPETPGTETPGTETPGTGTQDADVPVVTVTATPATVAEGSPVLFTLTATPAPVSALTVNVGWSSVGSFLTGTREQTVTIPTGGEAEVPVTTDDDGTDESDGSVTLIVADGTGYTPGAPRAATVAITDNDDGTATPGGPAAPAAPAVTVVADADSVTEGTTITFTLTATPAPVSALTVNVVWSSEGSFLTGTREQTVTIPTGGEAEVQVTTDDDSTDEPDGSVTLTVVDGSGYTSGGAKTVAITDNEEPSVSVAASPTTVTEGGEITFTLTATPTPASALTVNVNWSSEGSFLTGTRPPTVTIPTAGEAEVKVGTHDDGTDEPNGSVTLTVADGTGYTPGTPASASATINDNDDPVIVRVTAEPKSVTEGGTITFELTAFPSPASPLTVNLTWSSKGSFLTGTRPSTVQVSTRGKGNVRVPTVANDTEEPHGSVTATVAAGTGYTPNVTSSATATILDDDDDTAVSVAASATSVNRGDPITYTFTAAPLPLPSTVTLTLRWSVVSWGVTPKPTTITIPTTGTATLTVTTESTGGGSSGDIKLEITGVSRGQIGNASVSVAAR